MMITMKKKMMLKNYTLICEIGVHEYICFRTKLSWKEIERIVIEWSVFNKQNSFVNDIYYQICCSDWKHAVI